MIAFPEGQPYDVVGIGLNAVDHLAVVADYPEAGTRARIVRDVRCGGGQVATALCTLARLGMRVKYLGKVGDDANGAWSIQSLAGVDVADVVAVPGEETQFAFIVVSEKSGERTILWKRGSGLRFTAHDFVEGQLTKGRLLHLDTHEIARNIQAAREARDAGVPVLIDAEAMRPQVDELLTLCDVVLADLGFARSMTGATEAEAALHALRHLCPAASIVGLTLGGHGSMAWSSEAGVVSAPAYPVEVVDTTGAGDVYHGAFGYGLLRGFSLEKTCRFANAVAALSCTALGGRGALPALEQVEALMGEALDQAGPPRSALPPGPLIDDAWAFAREAHRGQTRDEGAPYFVHPCRVARLLVDEFGVADPELIASALLHDTLEDVPIDHGYFRARFGERVYQTVLMLTKDERLPRDERNRVYFQGLEAASMDVLTIKMADRLDNLSRLHLTRSKSKPARYLAETREHYVPLSRRAHPKAEGLLVRAIEAVEANLSGS